MQNDNNTRDERVNRVKNTTRQTVLSGRTGGVHADFIEMSGLTPTLKASTSDPIIASIAKGYNTFGAFDKIIELTEDLLFPPTTSNATNFLGLDENKNPIISNLPPVYSRIFNSDRENKINASFNGNNGATEFIDEYGNHFRAYGTGWQISNINQYSGMNTARCNSIAAGNRWECTPANLDNRTLDQWTIECFYRLDSFATEQIIISPINRDASYAGALLLRINTSGQPVLFLSTDESSFNEWPGNNTTNMNAIASRSGFGDIAIAGAAHTAAQWYHMAWVYDGLHHKFFINGYLLYNSVSGDNSNPIGRLKPAKFNKIILGCDGNTLNQQLVGNISNFAFHPYAKYNTKKIAIPGDAPATRDIFTPPSIPLSLTTQSDRYYQESEAIYLDFESAAADDVLVKDKYGKTLHCGANVTNPTEGCYVESGAAKYGTKSLYFDGTPSYNNSAYIKAPVWADKWTVEFWGRRETTSGAADHKLFGNVVPGVTVGESFGVFLTDNNGANLAIKFRLGSTDSSADIISFDTGFTYSARTYYHFAVSYDGMTYRVFVDGIPLTSTVSQLKIASGSHFLFGRSPGDYQYLNGKIDDFAYVPYCKYTAGFTPPATALLSSMPEQYVFDTKKMQMYKGYPTSFTAENALFLGEALTSATNVEQITTYALNGEYEEWYGQDYIPQYSFTSFRKHNIGTHLVTGALYGEAKSSNYVSKNERFAWMTFAGGSGVQSPPLGIVDRKIYAIHFGSNAGTPSLLTPNINGTGASIDSANAHYFNTGAVIKRSF